MKKEEFDSVVPNGSALEGEGAASAQTDGEYDE
jgi:hypothetical protein